MHDTNFRKSMVYIKEHSGDGAKGWVVNKEVEPRVAVKLRKSIQLGVVCCLLYTSPSPRDLSTSRMPSSA